MIMPGCPQRTQLLSVSCRPRLGEPAGKVDPPSSVPLSRNGRDSRHDLAPAPGRGAPAERLGHVRRVSVVPSNSGLR